MKRRMIVKTTTNNNSNTDNDTKTSFWSTVYSAYKVLPPLKKVESIFLPILAIVIPIIMTIIAGIVSHYTSRAKIEAWKIQQERQARPAKDLANEIILEFTKMDPDSLPQEIRDVFSKVNIEAILSEINFDKSDMNLRLSFSTDYSNALLVAENNYDVGKYGLTLDEAYVIVSVFEKVINEKFEKLLKNMDISAKIIGIADGIPVKAGSIYRGEKLVKNERYFNLNNEKWESISLIPNISPIDNKSIAFLRAFYTYDYIKNLKLIRNAKTNIYIQEVEQIGPRKCVIGIELTVKNAVKLAVEELNFLEKTIYKLEN